MKSEGMCKSCISTVDEHANIAYQLDKYVQILHTVAVEVCNDRIKKD